MTRYVLTYRQTFAERYDTDVNSRARVLLASVTPVVSEAGGYDFTEEYGDQEFVIDTDSHTAHTAQRLLRALLERDVHLAAA